MLLNCILVFQANTRGGGGGSLEATSPSLPKTIRSGSSPGEAQAAAGAGAGAGAGAEGEAEAAAAAEGEAERERELEGRGPGSTQWSGWSRPRTSFSCCSVRPFSTLSRLVTSLGRMGREAFLSALRRFPTP